MTLRTLLWAPGVGDAFDGPGQDASPATVILVHGFGDTADIWRPLMQQWRPLVTTLAIDLPGHGRSPRLPRGGYVFADVVDHVARTILDSGISRPVLIGHSLGAHICANLALFPELRPRGIVLIDMGAGGDDAVSTAISDHIDAVTAGTLALNELIELFLDRLPLSDRDAVNVAISAMAAFTGHRWRVPLDPEIKSLLVSPAHDDIWRVLPRITGPVEVIRGAFSAVLGKAAAERITAAVRRRPAAVRVIDMAGHAIPLEQPGQLAGTLDACLAGMALFD